METKWQSQHTLGLFFFALTCLVPPFLWADEFRGLAWVMSAVSLAFFLLVAGLRITGTAKGFLIDDRNRVSLSRLQLALWTVLILSAFLTAGISNLGGTEDPMAIQVPQALWALMGISSVSLVGSPLVRSTKTNQSPDPHEWDRNLAYLVSQTGRNRDSFLTRGLIVANRWPTQAS